ncbi:MAG: nucleotidyl transferase AbiEii/AbiGii toxin family protein [Rhodospirillales bacterium]|nr:nucleotidyl transferase AbiEii/AbiGii toxin family protein [Acetobacter sp.]
MKPVKNVAASVHQRLLNLARASGRPFNELAQYYALERWLYRLACSEHRSQFVLKGALMLLVWKLPVTRPTRDIDLLGRVSNGLENVRAIVAAVCQVPVEDDGMTFDPAGVATSRIAEDADYEGVRATFQGALGNVRLPMQIDIGLKRPRHARAGGDHLPDPAQPTRAAIVCLQPGNRGGREVRGHGETGPTQQLHEGLFRRVAALAPRDFPRRVAGEAIARTFERRGTPLTLDPVCFAELFFASTAKAVQWQAFVRRGHFTDPVPAFSEVVGEVARFLRPVCAALITGQKGTSVWQPGGPWLP